MTDAVAQTGNVASSTPDTMEWDSRARRMVMIYLPLSCFVLILLFPFYWMAITSFKPNAELLITGSTTRSGSLRPRSRTSSICCSRPPIRTG